MLIAFTVPGRALVVIRRPAEIIWLSIGNRNAAVFPDPTNPTQN